MSLQVTKPQEYASALSAVGLSPTQHTPLAPIRDEDGETKNPEDQDNEPPATLASVHIPRGGASSEAAVLGWYSDDGPLGTVETEARSTHCFAFCRCDEDAATTQLSPETIAGLTFGEGAAGAPPATSSGFISGEGAGAA